MKIGLFVKPRAHFNRGVLQHALEVFEQSPFQIILEQNLAKILKKKAGDLKKADVIFSLGGDGTVLKAAKLACEYRKPLIGVNLGNLGFLTEVTLDELGAFLKKLELKQLQKDERALLKVKVQASKKEFLALNEVAIGRGLLPKLMSFTSYLDGKKLATIRGDGLLLSTATGSTAYSLAAGGPIMTPNSEAVIFNPICSHKLSNRPLVLDQFQKIKVQVHDETALFCDGEQSLRLRQGDELEVTLAKTKVTFLRRKSWDFFGVLKNKLEF